MQTLLIEKPFSFFDETEVGLANFGNVGDIVIKSDVIPDGHIATLKDLNTMFVTTGGSIDYARQTKSGKIVKFARNRQADDNGEFNQNFGPGERAVILINTAGAGVLHLVWHGVIKRVKPEDTKNTFKLPDDAMLYDGGLE